MAVFRMFRVFRIRREVVVEGVSEVRSHVPHARGGPLVDLLRLDPEPLWPWTLRPTADPPAQSSG